MTPQLIVRLADPIEFVVGLVASRWVAGLIELRIARTDVHPDVVIPLQEACNHLLNTVDLRKSSYPAPVVRCHPLLERDMHGLPVRLDIEPYQIDLYLRQGLVPLTVAEQLAGNLTFLLRHLSS
ncbi:hypothetical protein [Sphaerisporangium sp. TRM90804]|uniref:hypothetical protein n=1 Tax=Sphaerisporangium sp. TRM90804 TaxID=3031113 RepID=UPI00244A39CB|nr:hypothetical protein [Sphaerisporangium sp. TRM90804]MDH2425726.1 hypothetical protein [Sphaerisporangium sp. TRM90804]